MRTWFSLGVILALAACGGGGGSGSSGNGSAPPSVVVSIESATLILTTDRAAAVAVAVDEVPMTVFPDLLRQRHQANLSTWSDHALLPALVAVTIDGLSRQDQAFTLEAIP